jgi:hypothetical protein
LILLRLLNRFERELAGLTGVEGHLWRTRFDSADAIWVPGASRYVILTFGREGAARAVEWTRRVRHERLPLTAGYMYARRKIEVTKCVVESAGLKDGSTTLAPKNLSPKWRDLWSAKTDSKTGERAKHDSTSAEVENE